MVKGTLLKEILHKARINDRKELATKYLKEGSVYISGKSKYTNSKIHTSRDPSRMFGVQWMGGGRGRGEQNKAWGECR